MSGNRKGGLKARETMKERYGKDFFKIIGKKGGETETNKLKGFAANKDLARIAGAAGGRISKRDGIAAIRRRKAMTK